MDITSIAIILILIYLLVNEKGLTIQRHLHYSLV